MDEEIKAFSDYLNKRTQWFVDFYRINYAGNYANIWIKNTPGQRFKFTIPLESLKEENYKKIISILYGYGVI